MLAKAKKRCMVKDESGQAITILSPKENVTMRTMGKNTCFHS